MPLTARNGSPVKLEEVQTNLKGIILQSEGILKTETGLS